MINCSTLPMRGPQGHFTSQQRTDVGSWFAFGWGYKRMISKFGKNIFVFSSANIMAKAILWLGRSKQSTMQQNTAVKRPFQALKFYSVSKKAKSKIIFKSLNAAISPVNLWTLDYCGRVGVIDAPVFEIEDYKQFPKGERVRDMPTALIFLAQIQIQKLYKERNSKNK